jgi:LEA14-like dessication related protein
MKTNIGVLIVIILIIINLIFGGILLYIITVVEAPDVVASIEILELNEEEIIIEIEIDIENPNFFSIIVEDFNIKCMNENGTEFGNIQIIGGEIEKASNSTFISNSSFSFENYNFEPIINKISGKIGFNFFGIINKKIPVNITLITHLKDLISDIKSPEITINARISKITEEGISFLGEIIIFNPNNFKIIMDDIILNVESDSYENVGTIEINSDEINPNSYKNFSINGNLSYRTLNADRIIINLNTKVGAHIAGFQKIINISSKTQFDIPKIQELLMINGSMNFSITGEFKLKIDGILANVGLIVYNPSEIPLEATDLICTISEVTNNETRFLVENNMESQSIPSKNEVVITTEFKIPYINLLLFQNGKIFPDWLLITIEGEFSIEGTNQTIPLSFNGYIDLDILH